MPSRVRRHACVAVGMTRRRQRKMSHCGSTGLRRPSHGDGTAQMSRIRQGGDRSGLADESHGESGHRGRSPRKWTLEKIGVLASLIMGVTGNAGNCEGLEFAGAALVPILRTPQQPLRLKSGSHSSRRSAPRRMPGRPDRPRRRHRCRNTREAPCRGTAGGSGRLPALSDPAQAVSDPDHLHGLPAQFPHVVLVRGENDDRPH
jgi:hypothetical protein